MRTPGNDEHGFLIECYLEYPSGIHEKRKNFPFFPDKKTFKIQDFSPYMMKNKPEKYKPTEKLIIDQKNNREIFT